MNTRTGDRPRPTQGILAAALVAVLSATTAAAQSPEPAAAVQSPGGQTGAPTAAFGQTQSPASSAADAPYWELIGGFEGDTHGASYAFFGPSYTHPINPGLAWMVRVFPNFLSYEFDDAGGTTTVRSPGVATMFGLRVGGKNFFSFGAGPEVKFRRTAFTARSGTETVTTETRGGINAGAEVYVNPSSHNNFHGQVNYNTSDRYTWGRLGFKEQVSNLSWQGPNTVFLGAELIGQGNQEIKSTQFGGFVEVTHVPASLSMMFKAGYKRSTFPFGPDKTGPYFAVTFYQRLK